MNRMMPFTLAVLLFGVAAWAEAQQPAKDTTAVTKGQASLRLDAPMPPPRWAVLERQLLDDNLSACREFYNKYFDDRGYLLCVVRWGAYDGPDDAPEKRNT